MSRQTVPALKKIALIHTVANLIPRIDALVAAELPEWARFHMVDESLLKNTIDDGSVSQTTMRRLLSTILSAVDAGATAVVVTCSSLGTAVEAARPFCPVPLFRLDQGMAETAVRTADRIGVLATLTTTLAPTTALIETASARNGRPDQKIISQVCEGAFQQLAAGNAEGHDLAVAAKLAALADKVDVIVLAQASMVRALESMEKPPSIPILTSPELGVAHIRQALA